MKLNAKISLLAGAIALMGVVYMPQASATIYTLPGSPLTVPGGAGFSNPVVGKGTFTDFLDFSLQAPGDFAGTISSILKIKGSTSSGISLTSFALYSGSGASPGTLLGTADFTVNTTGVTNITKSFFGNLDSVTLAAAPQTYTLKIVGDSATSAGGFYSGGVNVENIEAVPEPEEWAMMLIGAGLVSYQVRRKQKGLRQSVVA